MSTESNSSGFRLLSFLCLAAGTGFFFVFIALGSFEGIYRQAILFGKILLFAGISNALAFLVLHRMKSSGYKVGFWRWTLQDFRLYKEYWRIAPAKGWSRSVLSGAILFFGFGVALLLFVPWT